MYEHGKEVPYDEAEAAEAEEKGSLQGRVTQAERIAEMRRKKQKAEDKEVKL